MRANTSSLVGPFCLLPPLFLPGCLSCFRMMAGSCCFIITTLLMPAGCEGSEGCPLSSRLFSPSGLLSTLLMADLGSMLGVLGPSRMLLAEAESPCGRSDTSPPPPPAELA